jgi:hypothetical protein
MAASRSINNGVIVRKYNINKLADQLRASVDDMKRRAVMSLQYIGEECIRVARECGDYNDITGNLRSSIGYIVLDNGSVVTRRITQPTTTVSGDGSTGTRQAQNVLSRLKSKYPRGLVLIVCAGMEYAVYVENVHGKRVLVDARLTAERLADKLFGKR